MDQHRQVSIGEVLKALDSLVSSGDLAISRNSSSARTSVQTAPVLPRNITNPSVPSIEHALTSPAPGPDSIVEQNHVTHQDKTLHSLATHLNDTVLPYLNLSSLSPNYYGFVTGGATPAALLGDFLASIYDQNVQVHLPKETLATTLEAVTLNMLVRLFRLPEAEWAIGTPGSSGGGTFTTGATASNVLGLALGREHVLRERIKKNALDRSDDGSHGDMNDTADSLSCGEYGLAEMMIQAGVRRIQVLSTLPHSSIAKAASLVGIGRRNVIDIASKDDPLKIDILRLQEEASKKDVLNILAISAGEVNTGRFATDSLQQWTQIRRICDEHGVWIHVDGAFGLFGRLFTENDCRSSDALNDDGGSGVGYSHIFNAVQGIELADSITGDCHKLLNVPYDCGVFFTRHKSLSEDVCKNGNAAYLTSGSASAPAHGTGTRTQDETDNSRVFDVAAVQSPLNIGIENSRRFRALPVYCTLVAYGRGGYVEMLKRQIGLARRVTRWLLRDARFEVLPTTTNTGTAGGGDAEEEDTVAKTFIVVLFRVKDDEAMQTFVQRVNDTGKIYMTGTVWEGKKAARIAVSNWQVDVQRDGELIEAVLDEVVATGVHVQ